VVVVLLTLLHLQDLVVALVAVAEIAALLADHLFQDKETVGDQALADHLQAQVVAQVAVAVMVLIMEITYIMVVMVALGHQIQLLDLL
jgi:predicted thioesterase